MGEPHQDGHYQVRRRLLGAARAAAPLGDLRGPQRLPERLRTPAWRPQSRALSTPGRVTHSGGGSLVEPGAARRCRPCWSTVVLMCRAGVKIPREVLLRAEPMRGYLTTETRPNPSIYP